MPPRPGAAREREIDFSAVGKFGRRTGATLEQRPLDENGLEEISHIFSSPRKPSPLKHVFSALEEEQENASTTTPKQPLSIRKALRGSALLPRSASPRKSGINGTAKRSNAFSLNSTKEDAANIDLEERQNTPFLSPSRANQLGRRFSPSPERSPLRDITITNNASTPAVGRSLLPLRDIETAPSIEESEAGLNEADIVENNTLPVTAVSFNEYSPAVEEHFNPDYVAETDDNPGNEAALSEDEEAVARSIELGAQFDDEDADQTFDPTEELRTSMREKAKANSRRKRKSDAYEEDVEAQVSSPVAKKARRESEKQSKIVKPTKPDLISKIPEKEATSKPRGRPPKSKTSESVKLSARQEKELAGYVEKVRERPGPPKSLYLLRRETPADGNATHTRSGRISVKPLAYWRNERMVYGGSPSTSLTDGARFPLNSIKEIIRTEETYDVSSKKAKKKGSKGKGKEKVKARGTSAESDSSDSEQEEQERDDPYAEDWETEIGTFRGAVSVWDPSLQAPIDQEEEVDIAYAPAAIQFRENKGSSRSNEPTFSYAKLLSSRFLGVGIVELPPGGVKSTKNSRKMHMSFFVVKGRVTVTVSPVDGEQTGSLNRFSIGKGGFWQVPRGNDYSIHNELDKTARIFFSQGCEAVPVVEDE